MTAIADQLHRAGVDTVGPRLTSACIDAIRLHPQSVEAAWEEAGRIFGYGFIAMILSDMQGPQVQAVAKATSHLSSVPSSVRSAPTSKIISPERLQRRRQLQAVVRSKYKNSMGVFWTDVSWHELYSLRRDGSEASALLAAGGQFVPNDGRTVGQVLGVRVVDSIISKVRSATADLSATPSPGERSDG